MAMAAPATLATRRGTTRRTCAASARVTSLNSRPSASSTAKVSRAVALTLKGCALVTGSMSISARMVFCQWAARHRNSTSTARQATVIVALTMRAARPRGSGSSRYAHSQCHNTPSP
ncbi:hypothetical protein D3C77_637270 [compost metagenome]